MAQRSKLGTIFLGTIFGMMSIYTLLFGWGVIMFMPVHDDDNGQNTWNYLWDGVAHHPSTTFLAILLIGSICGCVGGWKDSRRWYIVAALNAVTLVLSLSCSALTNS